MNITLVQPDIIWEQPTANLAMYDALLQGISQPTDLVLLPEMFTTGFSMDPAALAEPENGATMLKMREWAQYLQAAIGGSLIIVEDGRYYNRFVWILPDGSYQTYDKRHLFRMGGEHTLYAAGTQQLIINYKGWRIAPLVCYDLRFPVWSRRQLPQYDYDLLIYSANWPAVRSYAWSQLLLARAIENQAYTIGINRVGIDGNGMYHNGGSTVIDPKGDVLWTQKDQISVHTITLNKQALDAFRKEFPAWADADAFEMAVEPQNLIASTNHEVSGYLLSDRVHLPFL